MNIDNMELLGKALIGGDKYKWETTPSNALRHKLQAMGAVAHDNTYHYTVLGVMADVFIAVSKQAYWEDDANSKFPSKFILKAKEHEPWRLDIPQEVLDWYGLTREQSNQLWFMSARGYNFDQIGKSILKAVERNR